MFDERKIANALNERTGLLKRSRFSVTDLAAGSALAIWHSSRTGSMFPIRDSIGPRGGRRRYRALARETEPRLCIATVKLG